MEPERRPGDLILDRYMPEAAPEVRETARRRLFDFVGVMLRIAVRLEAEKRRGLNSPESGGRPTMSG